MPSIEAARDPELIPFRVTHSRARILHYMA